MFRGGPRSTSIPSRFQRRAVVAARAIILVLLLGSACTPAPDAIQIESNRISVLNTTDTPWTGVSIRVNRYYEVSVSEIPANGRFDLPVTRLQGGFGRYFDPARERVTSVTVTATSRDGAVTLAWPLVPKQKE